MLKDELLERLQANMPDIQVITNFWDSSGYQTRITTLEQLSQQTDFWQAPDQIATLKELEHIKEIQQLYQKLIQQQKTLIELIELYADDETTLAELTSDINAHTQNIRRLKSQLLLSGPDDSSACFLTVNSGAGGTESQDWTEMLLRMYVRFCERERLTCNVLDMQTGEGAGIKSATIYIKGKYAYGLLKNEHGIHRLVRISPFDANKRRHTSFAGVFVSAEVTQAPIVIKPDDLRIDTYRAGGAGGQHVNKTDSAVRITHLPTGIVTQCQNERSQMQNKETAMKMLMARLVQKQKDELLAKQQSVERKKIEWGSQIRSYVLHPYKMVKDHRTDYESPQPDLVLDGDIMEFIQAELIRNATT